MRIAEHLLESIWERSQGTYIFLATIKDGQFAQTAHVYAPSPGPAFLLNQGPRTDMYFTPLRFVEPQRTNDAAGPAGVLFADLDGNPPLVEGLEPSIMWGTSQTNSQAVWFLNDAISAREWRDLNKRLTYRLGADRGGWPQAKLLRIPGTTNFKYNPPQYGKGLLVTNKVYDYDELWAKLPAVWDHREPSRNTSVEYRDLPASIKHKLQRTAVPDRSLHLYLLAKDMRRAGIPIDQAHEVLETAPTNKFRGRPEDLMAFVVAPAYGLTYTPGDEWE